MTPPPWAKAQDTQTVTDGTQRRVEVPVPAERIIAIGPGALRLICYLDAVDKVVGVERFESVRPTGRPYRLAYPELVKLPVIGPGGPQHINKEPDLEAVLRVEPDVIFATFMKAETADALQAKLGIPVVVLSYGRFPSFDERMYDSLRLAGRILAREGRAEAVIDFVEQARQDLMRRTQGIDASKKPRVYVGGLGYRGLQGIESTDAQYLPLAWVRGENVARQSGKEGAHFVDRETLLLWNPDIIFIDATGLGLIRQDYEKRPQFYEALQAFQDQQVYILHPFIYYVANVGTAIADAYAIGKVLYPETFSDLDPREKADQIYVFLVERPVYGEMSKSFGRLLAPFPPQ
jgi:iron complex transport system substrate-binding protein